MQSAPPPDGWDGEIPQYFVTRDVHPSPNSRFRLEPPHSYSSDSNAYQYGERPLRAGEIVETRHWPHESFWPLNESARRVMLFFTTRQKSRLGLSPWKGDRIVLDDGLTGPVQLKFKIGATA